MATQEQLRGVLDHIQNQYYDQNAWRNGLSADEQQLVQSAQFNGGQVPISLLDRLRQTHQDVFDPATGQMVNGRHSTGKPPVSLPSPGPPSSPPPKFPGPGQGPPIKTDAVDHPIPTHFDKMDHSELADHRKSPKSVGQEMVDEFKRGLDAMQGADDGSAPSGEGWGHDIEGVRRTLYGSATQLAGDDAFMGAAGTALQKNLNDSLNVLHEIGLHADAMGMLFSDFFQTLGTTKQFFSDNEPVYKAALGNGNDPPPNDDVLTQLNTMAGQLISGSYNPNIQGIAARHPSVGQAVPEVGGASPVGPASAPAGPTPGAPTALGQGQPPAATAPGAPPQSPATAAPMTGKAPTDALKGVTDAAKGAGDAAKGLGGAAQKGLGSAANAAGQGLNALTGLGKGGAGLPREGVLNLGPKAPRGLPKTGRGGSGSGGHGVAGGKPAGQLPTPTKAAGGAGAGMPASRAGVSGAGGAGGAGTPAAGHRGGADKQHKANKALYLTKNGEEVVGEVEAVAPVIGGPPPKAPPKPSR